MNHLAIYVPCLKAATQWFSELFGGKVILKRDELVLIEWPTFVLGLKQGRDHVLNKNEDSTFSHYGFWAATPEEVDEMALKVKALGGEITKGPYDRSDGRAVYFNDILGLHGEFFYYKKSNFY